MGTKLGGIVDWVITPATKVAKVGYNKSNYKIYTIYNYYTLYQSIDR